MKRGRRPTTRGKHGSHGGSNDFFFRSTSAKARRKFASEDLPSSSTPVPSKDSSTVPHGNAAVLELRERPPLSELDEYTPFFEADEEDEEPGEDVLSQTQVPDEEDEENEIREAEATPGNSTPLQWTVLCALLTTTGTKRYTEDHYNCFRSYMNWNAQSVKLPSIKSVKCTIRPIARKKAFVRSQTESFPVQFTKSGARGGVGGYSSATHAPVMIVLPSEWAKKDISTRAIQDLLQSRGALSSSSDRRACFSDIEDSPIVKNRANVLSIFKVPSHNSVSLLTMTQGMKLLISFTNNVDIENDLHVSDVSDCIESDSVSVF